MNKYIVPIKRFFSGYELFKVEAECKEDALKIAKKHAITFGSGNYNFNDIGKIKKEK